MLQRVSDYIADFLVEHGIHDIFTVPGGGAMYLNDSFGHHPQLQCIYNHHEQASAMAAEAYARIDNRIAAVCVTTGPGATNAITGVICGWMDSIPMIIFSGQARYNTTVYASGLRLRSRGVQEFDIIESVRNMTKYCCLVKNPESIRYCLEKAFFLAKSGRPGPCWLDIPLDVQGSMIETTRLQKYIPCAGKQISIEDKTDFILTKISNSQRPILFVGNGVRLSGAHEEFLHLIDRLNIPVVTGMSSVDAIPTAHRLYVGRSGITGDRAGNFAVQNCDLLFSLGSRLSFLQTGFNYKKWAPGAYKIINDIDPEELKKDSICGDYNICCDAKLLIQFLLKKIENPLPLPELWLKQCMVWKKRYPVVQEKHYQDKSPNIYVFFKELTKRLSNKYSLVVSVGNARVVGSQASIVQPGMRFITNPSTAAMGYCLPAAIGVSVADSSKHVVLVTGDGSLQMNIQELQTIIHHKYPIIIFVINNQGYQSIRTTQQNYFDNTLVGVGPDSKDISFPDLQKIAGAYGFAFRRCIYSRDLNSCIEWSLEQSNPCICEIVVSIKQKIEPKVSSRRLPDGQMVSGGLEDMAPFLSREELEKNMSL